MVKKIISVLEVDQIGQPPSSPRSLEACYRMGIEPYELVPKASKDFMERNSKHPEIEKEAAKIRFEHFEQLRQAKLDAVCKEREMILKEEKEHGHFYTTFSQHPTSPGPKSASSPAKPTANSTSTYSSPQRRVQSARGWKKSSTSPAEEQVDAVAAQASAEASTILKLEEKRLERMKRRQQKEIQGIVEMEGKMAKLQAENAKREAEEQKKKLEYQKEFRLKRSQLMATKHQKEIEKKIQEDMEAQERKVRAKKEAEKEKKILEEEQKRLIQRQKEAMERDMERNIKAEEFRQQTQLLLQQQEEIVQQNRQRMVERERLVMKKMEQTNAKRHEEALIRRQKADTRIQQALLQNQMVLQKRKHDFDLKQQEASKRANEIHLKTLQELKERVLRQEKEEEIRQKRLEQARQIHFQNIEHIISKRQEMETKLNQVYEEREHERLLNHIEKHLIIDEKNQTVERIKRMEEYQRLQLLNKIAQEDEKSRDIKKKKQTLMDARKKVSIEAMLRKHRIAEAVAQMRTSNKFENIEATLEANVKPESAATNGPNTSNTSGVNLSPIKTGNNKQRPGSLDF